MQFLSHSSCNFKIARVNQVRFSVRFVAAISVSNMFETCCSFSATKIASSCPDINRLCKRALKVRLHRQFFSRQLDAIIARVNQVRFSVRFVAAISQGFRTCLKLLQLKQDIDIACVNGP